MRDATTPDDKMTEARDATPELQNEPNRFSKVENNRRYHKSKQVGPRPPRLPEGVTLVAAVWQRVICAGPRDIPTSSRVILDYFLKEADENGEVVTFVKVICEQTGLSRRTVQKHVAALCRKRWIWRTFQKVRRDFNLPTTYRLLIHGKPWAPSEREHDPRLEKSFPRVHPKGRGVTKGSLSDQPSSAFGEAISVREISDPPQTAPDNSSRLPKDDDAPPKRRGLEEGAGDDVERLPVVDDLSCLDLPPEEDRSPSPVTDPISPPIASLGDRMSNPGRIRTRLMEACMCDLIGDGFERRLDRLRVARQLPIEDFLPLIGIVGAKREAGIFDAAGQPSKWTGPVDAVRGYVYVALSRQKHHAAPKEYVKPKHWDLIWNPDREPRPVVDVLPSGEHRALVEERSLNACGAAVLAILRAEHHGETPLVDLAEVDFAHRLSQCSEDACAGGKLTTADVVATVRHFAINEAFRIKRQGIGNGASALRSYLTKAVREAQRGCAIVLGPQIDRAKFIPPRGPKLDVNQPGPWTHLAKPPPKTPLAPDEMKELMAFVTPTSKNGNDS